MRAAAGCEVGPEGWMIYQDSSYGGCPGTFRVKVDHGEDCSVLRIKFAGSREECDRLFDDIQRMVMGESL